jgi:hypothetical protein
MDLRTFNQFNGGSIDQYKPPRNFELAGQSFDLAMDDGYDYVLNFFGKDKLAWNAAGDAPKTETYECLKSDDTTYLVSFELAEVKPRVNHTYVIDLENMLITRIIASIGKYPRWPYLIKTEFEFGAIREEGKPYTTYPRHGYTSDMVGNIVQWTYGGEMASVHVYHNSFFYRITYPRDRAVSKEAAQTNDALAETLKALPSADEPAVYIKIKEGLYLFSIIEANGEKLIGPKSMFRSNTLCFLDNFKHCYEVGRGFGTSTMPDGTELATNLMFGSYGKVIDATDDGLKKMLTDPIPYVI